MSLEVVCGEDGLLKVAVGHHDHGEKERATGSGRVGQQNHLRLLSFVGLCFSLFSSIQANISTQGLDRAMYAPVGW